MKKSLFLVVFGLCAFLTLNAQVKIRYQGDLQAGYSLGIGTFSVDRANFHILNSVRIGDYFSAGVGFGFDFYFFNSNNNYKHYNYYYYEPLTKVAFPVYFNTKGYWPVSKNNELFLSMDIGTSIHVKGTDSISLLFSPSAGTHFKLNGDNAIFLSFGYVHQKLSKSIHSISADAIQFKAGFSF